MPGWQEIERNLVGAADLAGLIDQLSAVAPSPPAERPAILDVLGAHLHDILELGLATAPPEILETLERHPALLRDLQDLVFVEGGDYWMKQIDQAAAESPPAYLAMMERLRRKLADWTGDDRRE